MAGAVESVCMCGVQRGSAHESSSAIRAEQRVGQQTGWSGQERKEGRAASAEGSRWARTGSGATACIRPTTCTQTTGINAVAAALPPSGPTPPPGGDKHCPYLASALLCISRHAVSVPVTSKLT